MGCDDIVQVKNLAHLNQQTAPPRDLLYQLL